MSLLRSSIRSFFRAVLVAIVSCVWLIYATPVIATPVIATPLDTAVKTQTSTQDALHAGTRAFSEGRYEEALQQFTQSIESSPAVGYGNRCLVRLQMQAYSAAIEDCTQSLAVQDDAEVRMNLGLAYERIGEHHWAIAQYEQIIAADWADYRTYYNLALSEAADGSHELAINAYTQALYQLPAAANSDERATIYRDRGASYLVLTNYVAAVSDLNAAISRNPRDLWAYFNRGCAYHRSNNFIPALQDFDWVIEQDAQNAQAYFNRGIIYARLGQLDAAIASLTQAIEHFPQAPDSEHALMPMRQAQHLIEQIETQQLENADFFFLSVEPIGI